VRIVVLASLAKSLCVFRGPLLAALARDGHEVIACAPGENPDVAACLKDMGVAYRSIPIERTGINPARDLCSIFRLYRFFRANSPDVLLSYTIKPVIYGSLAARAAGVARIYSIITGLGYAFMGETFKHRCINRLARLLYRVGLAVNNRVFFQNPDDLSLFVELGLVDRDRQAVLINGSGVDLDYYAPAPLPPGPPVFLLIARLLKDKGVEEFVAAAGMLKHRYPDAVFRLLGPFDCNPSAIGSEQVRTWQDAGLVEYLGETDDVRPYIAAATVYVLPSYREGTPRSVLEAMAMGRPIVTTDAPGCRETVLAGENGFLVPVKDADALAKAMERFIVRPDLVASMGRRSSELVKEKYDVHKVNSVILRSMGLVNETNA
jgi:glycosyltransferase involved in cell wall biosynthesis